MRKKIEAHLQRLSFLIRYKNIYIHGIITCSNNKFCFYDFKPKKIKIYYNIQLLVDNLL